jgi:hypothetical protein
VTTPVGCTLWVDGVRVADGTPGDVDDAPTALSGLSIVWGRATTIDQVEPSTCSFQLMDPPGGGSFLSLLYTGARVDVVATGTVQAPATLPINADPGFESGAVGSTPAGYSMGNAGATLTVTAAAAATGNQSALWAQAPTYSGRADDLTVYPGPISSDPTAWDHLATVKAGEEWAVTVTFRAAVGVRLSLALGLFTNPNGARPGPWLGEVEATATGEWQTITTGFTATADQAGTWIGSHMIAHWAEWVDAVGTWADAAGTWAGQRDIYLDDVAMLAPSTAADLVRDVLAFSGRVTDLDAGWDAGIGTVVCSVVAADFVADLAQRDVSAEPWPAERLSARFAHVLAGAAVTIPYTIAPTLASWQVSYLDVDRQECWPLLADLATSVDGILWSATHRTTGPYLWLADPRVQSALYVLHVGDDGLVHVGPTTAAEKAITVDACDVLLDPVVFKQAVSDVTTRVAISWQEQTLDDKGQPAPTERTTTVVDAALETRLGTRRAAVSTMLTTDVDASSVAALILGRMHLSAWRVGGLTWRTDLSDLTSDQTSRVLDLLDGTRRLGAAILLTDLPDWSPTGGATLPLLLQGGTYTFDAGWWTLNLVTSSAAAQGSSLRWCDVDPAYSWNDIGPDVAWSDVVGVA